VNRILRYLPLLLVIPLANAQSALDVNVGLGAFHNTASVTGFDANGDACVTGVTCALPPALSSFFMSLGGDIMATSRFGIGGEVSLQPSKQDYAGLEMRQLFYDINGIYSPIHQKKYALRLEAGIGGAKSSFSYTASSCVGTAICQTQSQSVGSANHFQVHGGVGMQVFLTDHLFLRPQFDLRYVPNFTNQFGNNLVPSATVWFGYSMGER